MKIYKTLKTYFYENSINLNAKKIIVVDNYCYFKSNDILDENYKLIYDFNKIFKNIFLYKIGFILGFLLFLSFFFINKYLVNDIVFNDEFLINQEIKNVINKNLKTILNNKFINTNLNDLSKNLRMEYPTYEYINLNKKGATIYVTINKLDDLNEKNINDDIGSLYAIKDGIIKYYTIYNGKPLIERNDYVKKGDLLVSSNLLYGINNDHNKKVQARGLVIAETYEKCEFNILKKEIKFEYTGNIKNCKTITIFNKEFFKKEIKYNNYDKFIYSKKILGFIKIKKIVYKEKNDIINIYNKNEIIEKIKNSIYYDFLKKRVSEKEKIVEIFNVSIIENNDSFYISLIVKKEENIAYFVKE